MNKSYAFLIGILVILIIAIGGFAVFRASKLPSPSPSPKPPPAKQSSPPPSPKELTQEEKITQANSLPLTINSPQNNAEITSSPITISGTTSPNADVAVNDKDLKANSQGNFSTSLVLEEGENFILVVVSNEDGSSEWEGSVNFTPQPSI